MHIVAETAYHHPEFFDSDGGSASAEFITQGAFYELHKIAGQFGTFPMRIT